MSSVSKSKSKDKRVVKEQKTPVKSSATVNGGSGLPASAYNPLLGTFHTLEASSPSLTPTLHVNGRFRNMDDPDDHSGSTHGSGADYDSASNNDSRSVESEEHNKERTSNGPTKQEVIPGADNDKREKIRQKNERKHQRQKERRAQELHERCSGYLMSRKLEALAQQLVAMGFTHERATMALILNEGKVEEAVAWLFEGGEDADKHKDQNLDTGSNLKIDISEELALIAELEIKFKCSKQDVERAIVACEGDMEKAEETLRSQKQDPPSALPKPEETGDPPTISNVKVSAAVNQSNMRLQSKPNSASIAQRKDDKDFNYTKAGLTIGLAVKAGPKLVQPVSRVQPKTEWARPQQITTVADKRWPAGGGSSPSVSYSLASPLQVSPPPAKTEPRYIPGNNEYKNVQPGSVREPVVMMQRPQSVNAKQAPVSSISSSPPGTGAGGWYPTSTEILKPNGLLPNIPSTRSLSPNNLSSSQFYHPSQYQQQHQPFMSGSGPLDNSGASRVSVSWSRTSTSPTLAPASSLGLFSGLGSSNCTSGSTSPVDWNTSGSMPSCDYASIDWSLDRSMFPPKHNSMWVGLGTYPRNGTHIYDSGASTLGVNLAMRPSSSNGNSVPIVALQDGGTAAADSSGASSREWTSPFEGKDLFSLPRQFVSSPSL
uniref:UBA domain-containing protein n=1 Tax=Opuntia streptacantha TaxID=393608 RepID=A0A7C9ELG7_OPUST